MKRTMPKKRKNRKKMIKEGFCICILLLFATCSIPSNQNLGKNKPRIVGIMDTMTVIFKGKVTTKEKVEVKNAKIEIAHYDRPNQTEVTSTNDKGRYFFRHISGGNSCYA